MGQRGSGAVVSSAIGVIGVEVYRLGRSGADKAAPAC
jgi:hypothetical protein